MRRFSISRLNHQVMLPRVLSPPAFGPLPCGLFSHRLWLLSLLVVAGSVLVGCGDAPTGGGALLPPAAPPPPPPPPSSGIAFESRRDGIVDIYVMNADGTAQTNPLGAREGHLTAALVGGGSFGAAPLPASGPSTLLLSSSDHTPQNRGSPDLQTQIPHQNVIGTNESGPF
jgi:hypothetical protein